MNIYVAAKFELAEDLQPYIRAIRDLGHRITHDWTIWEKTNNDDELGPTERHAAGMLDYAGVMQAELLIYWDRIRPLGAAWECGMAAARGIPIWIVEYTHPVIFDVLPMVRLFPDWHMPLNILDPIVPVA
jgi:hypothetical protein